jgi:hypothetical protein
MILRNAGIPTQHYTVSEPRRERLKVSESVGPFCSSKCNNGASEQRILTKLSIKESWIIPIVQIHSWSKLRQYSFSTSSHEVPRT